VTYRYTQQQHLHLHLHLHLYILMYEFIINCGDRLLTSPCLLTIFYRNVQRSCWFTYLHMHSYQSLFVPVYVPQLHCCTLLCSRWPSVQLLTCLLAYDKKSRDFCCVQSRGAISWHFSSQTLLNKDRQCCESWKNAKLGVCAVYAVGDTTDEEGWVDLMCCSPHCDTAESCLTNDTLTTLSSSSDCYDDWCRPSPTVRRPS